MEFTTLGSSGLGFGAHCCKKPHLQDLHRGPPNKIGDRSPPGTGFSIRKSGYYTKEATLSTIDPYCYAT